MAEVIVTLGAEIIAALPEMRAHVESLMTDACKIRRATGATTTDPTTFAVTPVVETIYAGRCKVQSHEAFEQERESAAATVRIARVRVDVPVGAVEVLPGDVVTITAAEDSLLVGHHYRLAVPAPYKSHATAYRVAAEELTGVEVPSWA